MSETIYRLKSEWIDGHKLVKTVDTHDIAFFVYDDETEELGKGLWDTFGTWFCVSDGTAFMGEMFYEDICDCIDCLRSGEYDGIFSQKAINECIEDYEAMRIICEEENEDFFQIYIL